MTIKVSLKKSPKRSLQYNCTITGLPFMNGPQFDNLLWHYSIKLYCARRRKPHKFIQKLIFEIQFKRNIIQQVKKYIFQHVLLIFCKTKIEFLLIKWIFFRLSHFSGKRPKLKIHQGQNENHNKKSRRSIFLVF